MDSVELIHDVECLIFLGEALAAFRLELVNAHIVLLLWSVIGDHDHMTGPVDFTHVEYVLPLSLNHRDLFQRCLSGSVIPLELRLDGASHVLLATIDVLLEPYSTNFVGKLCYEVEFW